MRRTASEQPFDSSHDPNAIGSATEAPSHAEAEAITERELQRHLAQRSDMAWWAWDLAAERISYWSPGAGQLLGHSREELYGAPDRYFSLIHPDDQGRVWAHYAGLLARGCSPSHYELDYRIVRKGGGVVWIHETGSIEVDAQGTPLRYLGSIQDVTRFRARGLVPFSSGAATSTGAVAQPEKPRLLVVDDEPVARLMAVHALESAGFEVEQAEDGERALAAMQRGNFDAILLDVMMPVMDGFEVCAAVRGLPARRHTPIIIMTALDDVESIERAYHLGSTDFISKPINPTLLAHRVRHVLRAHHTATALRNSEARLANAQRIARLGHWELDTADESMTWSSEAAAVFRRPPGQLPLTLGALRDLVHPDDWEQLDAALRSIKSSGLRLTVEHRICCPDGSERVVYEEAEAMADAAGKVVGVTGTVQDITERRMAEERIHQLAHFDGLTGLPNRANLRQYLKYETAQARRNGDTVSLLSIGLDNFMLINDGLGRAAGDAVIKELVARLLECLRSGDCVAHTRGVMRRYGGAGEVGSALARLGGDEFMVVLSGQRRVEDTATVARRLIATLKEPFTAAGQNVIVTMSIGIISYPENGEDLDTLLQNADAAMHHARDRGRNNFLFYSEEINRRATARFQLEDDLRKALAREEFSLVYQPKVDGQTGRVLGAEALARWAHPTRGMVPPLEFIAVAEEAGLIRDLGRWVLYTACRQNKVWQETGQSRLAVAVNLSPDQFSQDDLVDTVRGALEDTGLEARYLELELTESILMADNEASIGMLRDLKALGVSIAIDDFGTGYSSMSYLKRFPIDIIKIDRSFVSNVHTEAESAAIVRAIIGMTHGLHLCAVAEGVESAEEWGFLRHHRCDQLQGYYFGRPVDAEGFAAYLTRDDAGGRGPTLD